MVRLRWRHWGSKHRLLINVHPWCTVKGPIHAAMRCFGRVDDIQKALNQKLE